MHYGLNVPISLSACAQHPLPPLYHYSGAPLLFSRAGVFHDLKDVPSSLFILRESKMVNARYILEGDGAQGWEWDDLGEWAGLQSTFWREMGLKGGSGTIWENGLVCKVHFGGRRDSRVCHGLFCKMHLRGSRVERPSRVRNRGEKGLKGGKFRKITRLPYWSAKCVAKCTATDGVMVWSAR